MDAEDVVVGREHAKSGFLDAGLRLDSDLSIVNTTEITAPSWLMFFWFQGETVSVHAWRWGAGVVHEWLNGVEVLAGLLLEAILAVEDQLEGIQSSVVIFGEVGTLECDEWDTSEGAGDEAVRLGGDTEDVRGDSRVGVRGAEGVVTVVQAPDKFLDWVVVGETLLDFRTGADGVGTGVLDLLDEVFVTLLRKSASFLGVEIHVVGPDLESGAVGNTGGLEVGRQIEIQSDFVVLEGDQRQRQSGVAVEEKDEWQEDLRRSWSNRGGHFTPVGLSRIGQVQLCVQSPPSLVVLVNSLTTNRQFAVLDGTLSGPSGTISTACVGEIRLSFKFDVHVTDQITVSGDSHGNATRVRGSTVDSLFDVFHRKVCVAFVDSLEKSDFWVTSQVDILGAVGDELHETTGHFVCFCTIG